MNLPLEEQVLAWLAQQDVAVYLVGGSVRDRLLCRPLYDLDLAVEEGGLVMARRLADRFRGAYYPLDEERDTGRALLRDDSGAQVMVDIAGFRGPDLAADLVDRDLTINALAVDVRAPDQVIDQHGGMEDLASRLIRPVSENSIRNDPVRALRAVRQAAELGFDLAPETEALIHRDGGALAQVSGERIRDEFSRLLARPQSAPYLEQLDQLGLLTIILPELEPLRGLSQPAPHHLDVFSHSLLTAQMIELLVEALRDLGHGGQGQGDIKIEATHKLALECEPLHPFAAQLQEHLAETTAGNRTRLVTLKLAALLHDTGKAGARSVDDDGRVRFIGHELGSVQIAGAAFQRLRFSRAEVRLGETIVRHHMRPLLLANQETVSVRAVYRFFQAARQAGVDVLLHALADSLATFLNTKDDRWSRLVALTARMLTDYYERRPQRVDPPTLVDGHDLIHEFGLLPSPQIGQILESIREAQVCGEIHDREQALVWVHDLLDRGKPESES